MAEEKKKTTKKKKVEAVPTDLNSLNKASRDAYREFAPPMGNRVRHPKRRVGIK